MPFEEWSRTGNNAFQKDLTILNYNTKNGKILSYKKNDDLVVNIVWSYKNKYPVAIIENVPFELVNNLVSTVESFGDKVTLTQSDIDKLNRLLSIVSAQVTVYTYFPLLDISSATDPSGIVTKYDYDSFGRLIRITQADKVIGWYDYHYKN